MRTVQVSRHVGAQPAAVARLLEPGTILEYEGSFTVRSVEEREDDWLVTAGGPGLEVTFRFERLAGDSGGDRLADVGETAGDEAAGFYYEQLGEEGPLDVLETRLTYAPEREGTRVTLLSTVHVGVPPAAVTDRIAAWKRRGELERALEGLAADLE